MLAKIALELNLSNIIYFSGKGILSNSILADVCESLIAAIYLDSGLDATRYFLVKYWGKYVTGDYEPPDNPKTKLQEWLKTDEKYIQKIAREKFMMVLPGEKVYRVKDEKIIDSH